jgi:hypothetical protein
VVSSCVHDNEGSSAIKGGKFLDYVRVLTVPEVGPCRADL